MRILITGIAGFVGSTLAKALVTESGIRSVVGIDNFSRPGSELNVSSLQAAGIRIIRGDIRNPSDVGTLPACDWLIDAAANPSVLAGVDGKTSSRQLIEHNLAGTINLLEYCKATDAGLTLLSTSRVYSILPLTRLELESVDDAFQPVASQTFVDGISATGVSESYSTEPPVSLYGSTKVASEHLALEYGATFDFPVWVNRCGVMAGPGQFGHPAQGIFSFWIHSFREQSPLKYIGFGGHGYQVRDCLHPADLVPLMQKQWEEPLASEKPRICNVSGGIKSAMSLRQLSSWCEERFGPKAILESAETRPFDIAWMVLDPALAESVWQWEPKIPTVRILEQISDFADEHPSWLHISNPRI